MWYNDAQSYHSVQSSPFHGLSISKITYDFERKRRAVFLHKPRIASDQRISDVKLVNEMRSSGRLNIKMSPYQYRDSHYMIRRSDDRFILIMEIPIPGMTFFFYWDRARFTCQCCIYLSVINGLTPKPCPENWILSSWQIRRHQWHWYDKLRYHQLR